MEPCVDKITIVETMTTLQAAQRLGVTPRSLYQLIDDEKLAAYRDGRTIRLDRDEVERFAEGLGGGTAHDRAPRRPRAPHGAGSIALSLEIDESPTDQSR